MTDRDEKPEAGTPGRKERKDYADKPGRPYNGDRRGGYSQEGRGSRFGNNDDREKRGFRRDGERDGKREGGRDFKREGSRPPHDGKRGDFTPGARGDKGKRPFRSGPHPRDVDAIRDIDEEILRLILRRTSLLSKVRTKGRISPEVEKDLRQAWERKAARLSRDVRLGRDLFNLLQAVDPQAEAQPDRAAYNLSPLAKPVEIDLPAPADPWLARCWMALASASGSELTLENVSLTEGLLDAVKALNVLGGKLWWEEGGLIQNKGGKGLTPNIDKVVQLGGDEASLWLILAMSLGVPMRLKFMGRHDLDHLNLAPVGHFLPQLGARLTNVIPGQEGLPIRLESSGLVPEDIELTDDLPPDFVAALLLAAPFREKATRLHLPASRVEAWLPALAPIMDILRECGFRPTVDGDTVIVPEAEEMQIPERPELPVDTPFAASLLAMAGLTKGRVTLKGHWPEGDSRADAARALLRYAGLEFSLSPGKLEAVGREGLAPLAPDDALLASVRRNSPELLPLALIAASAQARAGGNVRLPSLKLDEPEAQSMNGVIEDFLAQVGLEADAAGALKTMDQAVWPGPWLSPSPMWAVGLALGAFLRPNLRMVNPNIMNRRFPSFWRMYNSLPRPDLTPTPEPQDDKPVRRRIIAAGVFGELPPDPPANDDF